MVDVQGDTTTVPCITLACRLIHQTDSKGTLPSESIELDYQERIYKQYASVCRGCSEVFDEQEATRSMAAFSRYLAGWLPAAKNANILDLACGSGKTLFFLRENGYTNISGVDISAEQVALARQVTSDVTEGDILEFLGNTSCKYDLIIAQDIVEHLGKNQVFEMLDACHTSLTPGGRLILSSPNAESPMFGSRRYGDFTHGICFTPAALSQVLEIAGFEEASFREIGPYCHGVISGIRALSWAVLRRLLMAYNLVELGHVGSGIFTRDFLICVIKPSMETEEE